jgi:rubrerythrin
VLSRDRFLRPLHAWVWRCPRRRGRKLLTFARTEADGSRHLARAAERTRDGRLRTLFLRHAADERRHADTFTRRGRALLANEAGSAIEANWLAPGERGLDELRLEDHSDASLLAFLHLSERAAAQRFAVYRDVLACDPETREVFGAILRDEVFHMSYTKVQLERVSPLHRRQLLWARAGRLWKAYLRLATAIAALLGTVMLLAQYFILLPIFALVAKRNARREPVGWRRPLERAHELELRTQY